MYLMKGMAALALCAVAVSCNRLEFSGQPEVSKEDAIANAELQLGASIDPNQDWKMTADATANVTVNETFGETYTVKIYANNPLADEVAYVLKQGEVQNGKTFTTSFTYPSGNRSVIVGITDSKGYTFYRAGKVENGVLNVTFGDTSAAPHRSMAAPACPGIDQPYDEAWVTRYLGTAKEPDNTNVDDNYDNGYFQGGRVTITKEPVMPVFSESAYLNTVKYNLADDHEDKIWYKNNFENLLTEYWNYPNTATSYYSNQDPENYVKSRNTHIDMFLNMVRVLAEGNRSDWITVTTQPEKGEYTTSGGSWVADETYATNFKITTTWNGGISVAASEGSQNPGCERTIVVTGTWNITDNQKIGSLGKIIIANGGTVNVASGKQLNMVNQAQLVILPGGTLTGAGKVEVNNGNAEGYENYNGGTVSVAIFNNNFGKFHNYGTFNVNEYWGGAQESNFYNHHLAVIDHAGVAEGAGSTANARIFNECQFYVVHDMRIRNYEGTQGSSLIVDGELLCSSSEDGTSDPTYVGLQSGAYVECGTLYNNGTSWSGPTDGGYAVVKIGQITYLNWEQDHPENGGYFANNIYVELVDGTNVPDGNGYHQTDANDVANHKVSVAHYKFFNIVANAFNNGETSLKGNGHVTEVVAGTTEIIPASEGFVKGSAGCTPGYRGDVPEIEEPNSIWSYAFEDTAVGDYDLNDVVLKAQENGDNIELKLVAAGATLNLEIRLYEYDAQGTNGYGSNYIVLSDNNGNTEVHDILGVDKGTMVNTGGSSANANPYTFTVSKSQYDASRLRLAIYSESQGEVRLSGSGDTPHGVMIPYDWRWPTERTRVTIAYNKTNAPETETDQSFTNFMSNAGHAEVWYKYPTKSTMNK